MTEQIVRNDYGVFRKDAWPRWEKEIQQKQAELRQNAASFTAAQRVDAAVDYMKRQYNADANETNFLARALIHVMTKVKEVQYPGDILAAAFPLNTEGGAGLQSMNFEVLDYQGEFKFLAGNGTDLPEVSATQSEESKTVGVLAAYYGFSQRDLERAMRGNVPLSSRKARAAMMAAGQTKNQIALNGKGKLPGLFSYPLNEVSLLNGNWAAATENEILEDVLEIAGGVLDKTEQWEASVILTDPKAFRKMAYLPRSSTSDTTIAEMIMRNTAVEAILKSSYLSAVTSDDNGLTGQEVLLAYPRNADILEFTLPRDVQQFPMQQHLLQFMVPLMFDSAGTFVYHPEAIAFGKNMFT